MQLLSFINFIKFCAKRIKNLICVLIVLNWSQQLSFPTGNWSSITDYLSWNPVTILIITSRSSCCTSCVSKTVPYSNFSIFLMYLSHVQQTHKMPERVKSKCSHTKIMNCLKLHFINTFWWMSFLWLQLKK